MAGDITEKTRASCFDVAGHTKSSSGHRLGSPSVEDEIYYIVPLGRSK